MYYIVRADYYSNGEIIPLGITDNQGYSQYLRKVKVNKKSDSELHFDCLTNTGKKVVLLFSKGKWKVIFFN